MFLSSADNVLQGLRKKQIRQVMRASLAFDLSAKKDCRLTETFMTLFIDKCIPARNVNGER